MPSEPELSNQDAMTQLRPSLRPRLRLFLSADIVGSTAFKQRGDSQSNQWFAVVLRFYQLMESEFIKHWRIDERAQSGGKHRDSLYGPEPSLWKTVGDEVLFSKELTHPAQAVTALHAWMTALDEVKKLLRKHGLDLKSCAWIADFPLRNSEVILRASKDSSQEDSRTDEDYFHWFNDRLLQEYSSNPHGKVRDFVGPSIDTGFRLGAHASPRKFVVSIELAYMLSGEIKQNRAVYKTGSSFELRTLPFRYDGSVSLKGVLNGAPYPIVWIDALPDDELHLAEDELLPITTQDPKKIHAFAKAFMGAHADSLCSLCMTSGHTLADEYTQVPARLIRDLKKRQAVYDAQDRALQAEQQQNAEPDEGVVTDTVTPRLRIKISDLISPRHL